jgi:DnaK suppressor protein
MSEDTPAPGPLTDEDRQTIRARLTSQREALRVQLEQLRETAAPVSLDLSIGRLSRMDAMQQQQMANATRRRADAELGQIAAALHRLDAGSFGECASCGDDIDRRRLLARPSAPCCRDCEGGGR